MSRATHLGLCQGHKRGRRTTLGRATSSMRHSDAGEDFRIPARAAKHQKPIQFDADFTFATLSLSHGPRRSVSCFSGVPTE